MIAESTVSSVLKILLRDLQRTIEQVELYESEEALWTKEGVINNSAGNLALHVAGAVNHFIGALLGKSGYVRDREKEFSERLVPREELIKQLHAAKEVVLSVLENVTDEETFREFPEKIGGNTLSINFFLIQLVSHLNYHLGQINYHRRLLNMNQ
jgi:uncharacterized damage-inducible protein DinB